MVKTKVERGTRKRFQTTITDLAGDVQDPDTCYLRFEKIGGYMHGSYIGPYVCSKVGGTGVWGANVTIPDSMTLGDWLARFYWVKSDVSDNDSFEFTVIRKDKPWVHTRGPVVP